MQQPKVYEFKHFMYPNEKRPLAFDVSGDLGADTITAVTVTITTIAGTDPSPDSIKLADPIGTGGDVILPVQPLLDNVTYGFEFVVQTSNTNKVFPFYARLHVKAPVL